MEVGEEDVVFYVEKGDSIFGGENGGGVGWVRERG